MTAGSPARHLLLFSLPLILTNLGQQLYMIVDAAIVGRGVGVGALAAVGASDWSYWMILWSILGLTQGFATYISRYFGERNYREMNKTIATALLLTAIVSLLLGGIGLIGARPLLLLLDTPADILDDAVTYLATMAAGTLVVGAYNMAAAILRAFGDGRSPLYAMGIAALLNIGLDLLFVIGLSMGVFGAALASVLSQLIAFLYCLRKIRRVPVVRLTREDFCPDGARVRLLLGFSLPLSLQHIVIALGGMVLQSTVNLRGSIFVAGFTATNKLYGLLESSAISLGAATATFLSQNFGAKEHYRVRRGFAVSCGLAVLLALAVSLLVFPLGEPLLSLFVDPAEVGAAEAIAIGHRYLVVLLLMLIFLYLIHVFRNALQAIGISLFSMLSGVAELLVRVGLARVALAPALADLLFYIEPIAWLGALLLVVPAYFYYQHRRLRKIP